MKLVILFGPPAVDKMTVGQELEKITTLPLFHNHRSIELVHQFFDFGTLAFERLDRRIRFAISSKIATSDLDGLIFTYVWDLNEQADTDYIDEVADVFGQQGATVSYVELKANLSERLKRNQDAHRLAHKPSKRDVVASEASLRHFEATYRMNTGLGELGQKRLLTIDITSQEPPTAAQLIKEWLSLINDKRSSLYWWFLFCNPSFTYSPQTLSHETTSCGCILKVHIL